MRLMRNLQKEPNSNGLHPSSNGLQPSSNGLQPNSISKGTRLQQESVRAEPHYALVEQAISSVCFLQGSNMGGQKFEEALLEWRRTNAKSYSQHYCKGGRCGV